MSESTVKSRSQAPLRVVKVTPISTGKKSSAGAGDDSTSKTNSPASEDKIPIEEMINKGLDMAETGIGLGINIVARLGSIVKEQVFEKINTADLINSAIGNNTDSQAQTETHHSEESQASPSGEQTSYLFNRLPLHPGSDVSLSFSINNDSQTSEKQIQLKIEPFVGQTHHHTIDVNAFSVTPSHIVIAPVDFDKFVIRGKIPADTPEDTYYGWIIVAEQQTYQIPVVLVVNKTRQPATEQATEQPRDPRPNPTTNEMQEG